MQKTIWMIALLIMCLCNPVSAEFYKYTDQDGNIRFTDDLSSVPENQRPDVKSYEESVPTQPPAAPIPEKNTAPSLVESKSDSNAGLELQSKQIKETKDNIDKEYQALMKEKVRLETQAKTSQTTNERIEYNQKISKLNNDIAQYDQKRKVLNAEIEAYNAKIAEKNKKNQ